MKRKITRKLLVFLIVLFTVFSLTSCEGFILWIASELLLTDISGNVVNAQATGTATDWWLSGTYSLEGATISLYPEASTAGYSATATYTGVLNSSGGYTIYDIAPGRYKISGALSGWSFVPRYVDIDGDDMVIPNLIAYRSVANEVLIFVSWEDTEIDVDGQLSYDLDTNNGDRLVISTSNTTDGTYFNLDRSVAAPTDTSIPRVETISIAGHPNPGAKWHDTELSPLNIPYNQLRYYLTVTGSDSLTGLDYGADSMDAALAQVDIMYNGDHFGVWVIPYNTAETTLHVVTIDAIPDENSDGIDDFWIYSAGNATYTSRGLSVFEAVPVDAIY